MTRYHVGLDGVPAVCHAHIQCRLAGAKHFDSLADARVFVVARGAKNSGFLTSVRKTPVNMPTKINNGVNKNSSGCNVNNGGNPNNVNTMGTVGTVGTVGNAGTQKHGVVPLPSNMPQRLVTTNTKTSGGANNCTKPVAVPRVPTKRPMTQGNVKTCGVGAIGRIAQNLPENSGYPRRRNNQKKYFKVLGKRAELHVFKGGFTSHMVKDRRKRAQTIVEKVGVGEPVAQFRVDKQHKNGVEVHEVRSTGVVNIYDENKGRLVTQLIARPEQVERLYRGVGEKAPRNIIEKCVKNVSMKLNELV